MLPPFAVYRRRFYTSVAAMITKVTIIATMQIFAANITFSYTFRCCLACLSNELVSISRCSPVNSSDATVAVSACDHISGQIYGRNSGANQLTNRRDHCQCFGHFSALMRRRSADNDCSARSGLCQFTWSAVRVRCPSHRHFSTKG